MAYIDYDTFSKVHFAQTLQDATQAAIEAAKAVEVDDGLDEKKFIYLRVRQLRIYRVDDIARDNGWEIDRCHMRLNGKTVRALTLYRRFGQCARHTKAIEAAIRVFSREGYDVRMGVRYDWRTTCQSRTD